MSIDHSFPRYRGLEQLEDQRAWQRIEAELAKAAVEELEIVEAASVGVVEPVEESNK